MQVEFIKLKNKRFRVDDISHYSCHKSSNYTGNPPIIKIFKSRVQEAYDVVYWTSDGNRNPDKEAYIKDMNMLDELFLGKTAGEDHLLP